MPTLPKSSGMQPGSWSRDLGPQGAQTIFRHQISGSQTSRLALTLGRPPESPSGPLSHAEGQQDTLQQHGHTEGIAQAHQWCCACSARQSSAALQGCVSPESADLSPTPEQPGQQKPQQKETRGGTMLKRKCPGANPQKVPLSSHPKVLQFLSF